MVKASALTYRRESRTIIASTYPPTATEPSKCRFSGSLMSTVRTAPVLFTYAVFPATSTAPGFVGHGEAAHRMRIDRIGDVDHLETAGVRIGPVDRGERGALGAAASASSPPPRSSSGPSSPGARAEPPSTATSTAVPSSPAATSTETPAATGSVGLAPLEGSHGNFSADPLFCGSAAGHVHLMPDSPCLTAPSCGLIGALGEGCTSATGVAGQPVEETSWGAVKSMFR
jgi:hypothetical protein